MTALATAVDIAPVERFDEHDVVSLVRDVAVDGRTLPAGERVTIVGLWPDAPCCLVELEDGEPRVVEVKFADLTH